MKKAYLLIVAISFGFGLYAQEQEKMKPEFTEIWEPEPVKVNPGATQATPPSDANILFDGKDFSKWTGEKGNVGWKIDGDHMTVVKGAGGIKTKENFGDAQYHIEWRTPAEVNGNGQGRGNSGIFLQGKYELQVLDSYENRTYSNGQAGSIYKQTMPLVNATKKPGEWQTYDIIYTAPVFKEDGTLKYPAYITVLHNGVLVQNHTPIEGSTQYIGFPKYEVHGDGPLMLQDHGNPVSYRNIWVRKL
jgi:hypothetical protein